MGAGSSFSGAGEVWPLPRYLFHQIAEQRGAIIGGFSCSLPGDPDCNPPDFSYSPVDHDQRHTLNTGFTANLPSHTWFSTNVYYGSGFTNGLEGADIGPYNGPYCPCTQRSTHPWATPSANGYRCPSTRST